MAAVQHFCQGSFTDSRMGSSYFFPLSLNLHYLYRLNILQVSKRGVFIQQNCVDLFTHLWQLSRRNYVSCKYLNLFQRKKWIAFLWSSKQFSLCSDDTFSFKDRRNGCWKGAERNLWLWYKWTEQWGTCGRIALSSSTYVRDFLCRCHTLWRTSPRTFVCLGWTIWLHLVYAQ